MPSSDALKVFLSYASDDFVSVKAIHRQLRLAGFEPWMDQHSLEPGDRWENEIRSNLNGADVLCVVCSTTALADPDRYFAYEYRLGLEVMGGRSPDRTFIVPVRLDGCIIPVELGKFQVVDVQDEAGVERLASGLRKAARLLGRPVEPLSDWYAQRARRLLDVGRVTEALVDAGAAVELEETNARYRLLRAECYLVQKRYDQALGDLEVAASRGADRFSVETMRSRALREIGLLDEAIMAATAAIDAAADDPTGYFERGSAYERKRWIVRALSDYDQAISIHPTRAEFHAARGRCLVELEKDDLAIESFDAALTLAPRNPAFLLQRARALVKAAEFAGLQDGYRRAMADLDYAITIAPEQGASFLERGWIHGRSGNMEQAVADLDMAAQLSPLDAQVFFTRGIFFQEHGMAEKAVEELDTAVKLDPRDPENYAARGTIKRANGKSREAITDFTAAIVLQPENLTYYKYRGDCYQDIDDMRKALDDYQRSFGRTPRSEQGW